MAIAQYPDDVIQAIDIIETSFRRIQQDLSREHGSGYNYASIHHSTLGSSYAQLISGVNILKSRTRFVQGFDNWKDYEWALKIAQKENEVLEKKSYEAASIIQTQTENLLMHLKAIVGYIPSYPQQ